jgi:hypothetical protein
MALILLQRGQAQRIMWPAGGAFAPCSGPESRAATGE